MEHFGGLVHTATMPRLWVQIVFLATLVAAVYMHASKGQFMSVDDGVLVFKNPIVTQVQITEAFSTYDPELYIPFTLLSYIVEYALFGDNPAVYHLTNVLLHLLNSILVLLLVRLWTPRWQVPLFTAVLFAVHPINTEAVLWVSGRKDVLSAFFFLGSTLLYCKHRISGHRLPYYGSVLLFLCALFSKISVVVLPLLFSILDDLIPAPKRRYEQLSKWAYYIPAVLFLCVAIFRKFISVYTLGYLKAGLIAAKGGVFYVQKLLVPTDLTMFYRQSSPIGLGHIEFLLPVVIIVLLLFVARESRKIGKHLSFGLLWFGITLLPNAANASKGEPGLIFFASDRYVYIASIGIFFIASIAVVKLYERVSKTIRPLILLSSIALPCIYAVSAYSYSILWLSPETYMQRQQELYPGTPYALMYLSYLRVQDEDFLQSQQYLKAMLRELPDNENIKGVLSFIYLKQNRIEDATDILHNTLQKNPADSDIYTYHAALSLAKGDMYAAEGYALQSLANNEKNAPALQVLGAIALVHGDIDLAEQYYRKAVQMQPDSIQPKASLAKLLREKRS